MAIVNRDKDVSEQRQVVTINIGALATSVTRELWVAPYPCTVEAIKVMASGLSGAPKLAFQVNRFIVGTGGTVYVGVTAQAIPAYTTSGLYGASYVYHASLGGVTGSLNIQAKDVVEAVSSVANTAMADCVIQLQVKKTQDVLSMF